MDMTRRHWQIWSEMQAQEMRPLVGAALVELVNMCDRLTNELEEASPPKKTRGSKDAS